MFELIRKNDIIAYGLSATGIVLMIVIAIW